MASILAKAALVSALATAAAVGLVSLSGMIIFADIAAPRPASLAAEALPSPPPVSGVIR